jgi:hypothetical protein
MAHREIVSHHSSGDPSAAHVIANIAMESEGESRPSRIHLPYQDVRKFQNDGMEAEKIPKMLWKMLQELGYEKQPEYFGTQVTYEGSEPVWHVQVYIFTPKPLRGVFEVEKIHAAIAPRFVMLHFKLIWSPVPAIASSWTERSMLTFLNELVDLPMSILSPYKMKGTSSSGSK